ncbi:MAG: hypothetical protein ACJ74O_18500 [Frankiaceae bacterium]
MAVAGLIAWLVTALGGFVLLARYVSSGGIAQQQAGTTRFPRGLIFGHFGLAVTGLVVWILYLATDASALAWVALALLAGIAALGFTMFARWVQPAGRPAGAGTAAGTAAAPAESALPTPVVYLHGVLAVATVVLVLLAALGVGDAS